MDALAFLGLGNVSPILVLLPLPFFLAIVLLELAGFVLLLRSIYNAKEKSVRLDWQQHPLPIVERPESPEKTPSSADAHVSSGSLVDPGERYQGGFYSLRMGLGWGRGQTIGYGIYITNRRLFGVSQSRPKFDHEMPLVPQNISDDDNERIIVELSGMRQFQAQLTEVKRIDLQIPKGLFRTGHLEFSLANGVGLKIRVGRKQQGEQLKELLQHFGASVLTVS